MFLSRKMILLVLIVCMAYTQIASGKPSLSKLKSVPTNLAKMRSERLAYASPTVCSHK